MRYARRSHVSSDDLSLCAIAMLAVIVDHGCISAVELRESIVQRLPEWACADWPREIWEWYGHLQSLLDRNLVTRLAGKRRYFYQPTPDGMIVLRAWLHERGATMRSVS